MYLNHPFPSKNICCCLLLSQQQYNMCVNNHLLMFRFQNIFTTFSVFRIWRFRRFGEQPERRCSAARRPTGGVPAALLHPGLQPRHQEHSAHGDSPSRDQDYIQVHHSLLEIDPIEISRLDVTETRLIHYL